MAPVSRRSRPVSRRPATVASPSESAKAATAAADRSASDRRSGASSCSRGTVMATVKRVCGARLNAM